MPWLCRSKRVVLVQHPAQVTALPLVSQHEAAALHGDGEGRGEGDADGDRDEESEGDCAATEASSAKSRYAASNSRDGMVSAAVCV